MSFKLPNGTEVDCTLIQARRVWEICKLHPPGDSEITHLDYGILVRYIYANEAYLITSDGQVFNRNLCWCKDAPPPMESEKPPEVSEFHRGIIMAIETIWKDKFTPANWALEVHDILIRAAAGGKVHGLATVLETLAKTNKIDDVLAAVDTLRPKSEAKVAPIIDAYCRGKVDAIKVAWKGRFKAEMSEGYAEVLLHAALIGTTCVDMFAEYVSAGAICPVIDGELVRLTQLVKQRKGA